MMKKTLILLFLILPFTTYGQELSAILGGMVQSDRWIIRKDKFEEEFIGNVHYENDVYKIHADYALSKRMAQTYTLQGNVFASRTQDGTIAQLTANEVFYNKKKDTGYATPKRGKQVEAKYKTPNNKFELFADRIDFSDKLSLFKMQGNAELSDANNTLYAKNMIFNTQTGIFTAEGDRPVLWGFSDDGDYAMQADEITAQTKEGVFKAHGKVKGWITTDRDLSQFTQGQENGIKI